MQIVLEVLDKYADQIDVKNVLEICLRNEKKRFRDFYKAKVIKNSSIEKAIQESVGKLLSLNEKANQAINGVNKRLDAFDKNIDNISNHIEELSAKADKILGSQSKELGWANLIINSLDLCATVAGFMIISQKMDMMAKELGEISKGVKDLVTHQELLDQKEVKALINEYANIQNKEKVGAEVSVDDYYNLVNQMSLTISTLRECFIKDIGNREVYLEAISILLPVYTLSICKLDKAHYIAYGTTHINRNSYAAVLDSFVEKDFFIGVQECTFFDKKHNNSSRVSYEIALAMITKINEQRVLIADRLKLINNFTNKEKFESFLKDLNEAANQEVIDDIYANYGEEAANEVKEALYSS